MSRATAKKLLDFLYVHNPFYLISACLFVYGLKLMFRPGAATILFQQGSVAYIEPWGLLASLAGITLLMTITAVMIVRLGKVWEDARSLILIVLLMLFAMTVSMDELLNLLADQGNSAQHLILMFCLMAVFSVSTVEGMLRGLRLNFPTTYRLPLHLLLLVMIVWPATLLPEVADVTANQIQRRVAAFPIACGLLIFTLLPAVRKGSLAIPAAACPWTWPLYPWTAFGFLLLAVCLRSYSLTMSFDVLATSGHYWDTSFGLWQLTPIFLAALVILMEIGIRENKSGVQKFCMLAAPVLLPMAAPWIVPWSGFSGFRSATSSVLSGYPSPVYCTLICLILFYGRARYQNVAGAQWGLITMLLLSIAIHPDSFHHHQSTPFQIRIELTSWPLLAFAFFDLIISIRQKSAGKVFASHLLLLVIVHQYLSRWSITEPWATFICLQVFLTVILLIARLSDSEFSRMLSELATPTLLIVVTVSSFFIAKEQDALHVASYLIIMTMMAAIVGKIWNWKELWLAAQILAATCSVAGLVGGIRYADNLPLPKGTRQILLGLLSFATAVLISLWKAGLGRRWMLHRRRKQQEPKLISQQTGPSSGRDSLSGFE